ncbi:unnamed protein product [Rotaria socialis]|uniref:Uncharacterized protein n=1 Tax=Rotaria socialis TaxID=392032 RepID=A0A821ILV7_9BILA|nr:unnamed protein product [Rotaria socialis]CAF4703877.1 unnamed protein product [Rotaria socialis]
MPVECRKKEKLSYNTNDSIYYVNKANEIQVLANISIASKTRLYTRIRDLPSENTQETTKKLNVVIFDINIDINDRILNNPRLEAKAFTGEHIDLCIDYIKSSITNTYLFISNTISNETIQVISEISHIKFIYIFCNNDHYENYRFTNSKVQGTFNDVNTMFKKFQKDINELECNYYSQESSLQTIDDSSATILWWRIFDKILLHIRHTEITKYELVGLCRSWFCKNHTQLRLIDKFNLDYESYKAISWYTRDSFFYRLLNQTLRRDKYLNSIFTWRLVLTDIMSELMKTAQSTFFGRSNSHLIVYRGQYISLYELEKLKNAQGQLLCFNQFLSTSLNLDIARRFLGDSHSSESIVRSVLFEIEIDLYNITDTAHRFADISSSSYFAEEKEILFSMHSTFLVKSVELNDENIWRVHLKYEDNIWNTDFGERSIFSPHADEIFIRNLSKENKQFIAFQVLIDMILRLDQNKYAKDELLEFCRSKYENEPIEMRKINDFEQNYESKDAAKWYTKDSFLYRLLNTSLRIETIDSIVKMRYYIHDLHNQLAALQLSFIESLNGQMNLILYRGQVMKKNQLNEIQDNIGGFISINSFCSVTQDERVALAFSSMGKNVNPHEVSVIYEMTIDTNIRSTSYAKIDTLIPDEQEILFSMGATFKIGKIDELNAKIYSVKLTMMHIEDELWNKLIAHLK